MRLFLVVAVLLATIPVSACTVGNVCADAASSFIGTVIADGFAPVPFVELDWSTRSEPLAPQAPRSATSASSNATYVYRVSRCTSPNQCEWIATVRAVGVCGTEQPYTVIDRTPEPAPIYRLELIDPRGRVACTTDTVLNPGGRSMFAEAPTRTAESRFVQPLSKVIAERGGLGSR